MNVQPRVAQIPARSRSGSAMVFALMALLVASMMISALLKTATMSHRQLKRDEFRVQTSLLADAGIARAIVRLREHPDFSDEVWTVSFGPRESERTAIVQLNVAVDPDQSDRQIASIVAEYPSGHPDVVRISRKAHVPIRK